MPPADSFPALRRSAPRPGLVTRLHFGWFVLWGLLCTLFYFPAVIVHGFIRPGARTLHRWMVPWSRWILKGTGVRLHVERRAVLDPDQPVVFLANHQNALDILTTAAALPVPFGFTPKAGIRRIPLIGTVLRHTGNVFVDRSTARKAAQSLVDAGAQIREGNAVLIFPEGERTWRSEMKGFLRGGFLLAIEAGVPIVPVAIDGDLGLLDERTVASRPGAVRLVVGAPIPTAGCTREDVPALMEAVRSRIAGELGSDGAGPGSR